MGHDRLLAIAARHGATVEPRPIALGAKVLAVSGGLPLKQRAPQRQAYRLQELQRWSDYLDLPLNIHPKYFPVSDEPASLMIVAAIGRVGNEVALQFVRAIYRAVWVDERDIADSETLIQLAINCGLDGAALYAARDEAQALYDQFTQDAIDQDVFGAPWYVFNGESFWGQDRLEFLDRALAKA